MLKKHSQPTKSFMSSTFRSLLLSFLVTTLSFFTVTASAQTSSTDTATVRTDLQDYPPGATVYIIGIGFKPGEEVGLQVVHVGDDPDGTDPHYHEHIHTIADANGNISATWDVPIDGDAVAPGG